MAREQKTKHKTRTLRGVIHVGLLAKGLLLRGDLDLQLVLLCKEPSMTALLDRVADSLAIHSLLLQMTSMKHMLTLNIILQLHS